MKQHSPPNLKKNNIKSETSAHSSAANFYDKISSIQRKEDEIEMNQIITDFESLET